MKALLFVLGFLTALALYGGPRYNRVNNRLWTRIPPGYPPDWTGPRFRRWEKGQEVFDEQF